MGVSLIRADTTLDHNQKAEKVNTHCMHAIDATQATTTKPCAHVEVLLGQLDEAALSV